LIIIISPNSLLNLTMQSTLATRTIIAIEVVSD
jgi:hypothetical protein